MAPVPLNFHHRLQSLDHNDENCIKSTHTLVNATTP